MNSTRSFLKILATIIVIVIAMLAIVLLLIGRDAAEKIATMIAMPSGLIWLALMTLTIQQWPFGRCRSERPRSFAILLTFLLYSIAGNGLIASSLARLLEAPWLQIDPLASQPPDVVIVLGGGASPGANDRIQGNSSGDRLILAAQLAQQWPQTRFICTGRRIESMNVTGIDPAQSSRDVLVRLGVSPEQIEIHGGRNTSEEMRLLAEVLKDRNEPVGLLTSAWHMTRASRLARASGLNVTPLPADFWTSPADHLTAAQWIEAMIPNANSLVGNWWCLREYLGMALGR